MKSFVAANFFARRSEYPWLVRQPDQDWDQKQAVRSVLASRVTFGPSGLFERTFGCTIIAECAIALGSDVDAPAHEGEVRLRFHPGYGFFTARMQIVESCENLRLASDGSVHAVLAHVGAVDNRYATPVAEDAAGAYQSMFFNM